jgi:hypothetical protein
VNERDTPGGILHPLVLVIEVMSRSETKGDHIEGDAGESPGRSR